MEEVRPVHSKIGASSMYRWKNCPGSVKLSEGIPNKSSVYAEEGTAAHELIALAIERAFAKNITTLEVLNEIVKATNVYATYIESIRGNNPVHIEHAFDMSAIFPNLYGTADCVIYDTNTRVLHVIDYKHGQGLPVEVINNLQLSYYALGAMLTLKYPCTHVQMTIVQPRCYHPDGFIRSWKVPALYFIDFEADLIEAAKDTLKPDAILSSGSHCMFCLAKAKCPQKHKNKNEEAKKQFTFYTDPKSQFKKVELKDDKNDSNWDRHFGSN